MKQLELESLSADREAVKALLAALSDKDPIGRLSFEGRLVAIESEIRQLDASHETTGSVALLFAGDPVFGSRSIDAEFATTIVKSFQDMVAKRISSEEFGRLGTRGRIPERTASALAIKELVRGSVGFILEESTRNEHLTDTPIKKAIDEVTLVIEQASAENSYAFESTIENLDPRLLVSLREFFRALDDGGASVRIVEDERDANLDANAVRRGRERVETTEVEDLEGETVTGEILGLLLDSRRFEMRLSESGEIIKGTVAAGLAVKWLELIELPNQRLVGQVWRTKMKIREIRERNHPPRRLHSLQGLVEQVNRDAQASS